VNVTVRIPDDFAARFGSEAELGRRALEALALEEYRAGRLTRPELRQLLGFGTRAELDGFLKERGVFEGITAEEVEHDLQDLDREAAARDLVARFRAFRADKTLGELDVLELIREGRR
jgi:Uncharacterised protein family (UPF0175)